MSKTVMVTNVPVPEEVRPDWEAMTMAERGVVVEHALARLMGQQEPPVNSDGQRITVPEWDNLSRAAQDVFSSAAIADMQRAGAVPDVLTAEVKAELSKPGNEGLVAMVNSATGAVATLAVPRPYYEAKNESEEEARRLHHAARP